MGGLLEEVTFELNVTDEVTSHIFGKNMFQVKEKARAKVLGQE